MACLSKRILCLCVLAALFHHGQSVLEEISDPELKKLVAQEQYVIVLFSNLHLSSSN
jgi:hypothetical protein